MKRINIFFVYVSICMAGMGCSGTHSTGSLSVAFYNCENFYDTINDPARNDDDFTPDGKNKYNGRIYAQKLRNIATVLQSMGNEQQVGLVGLAEVENSTVLNALCRQPEIAGKGYKYILHSGSDERGINVALLYAPALFEVISSEPLPVPLADGSTRDVLHVCGRLAGDTVDVFVNHWPSRRGGTEASAERRAAAARVSRAAIEKLFAGSATSRVIVMGDFNDNPDDSSIKQVLGAAAIADSVPPSGLYNPFAALYSTGAGTEVYRHQWNLFDQIMVSGTMVQKGRLRYDSATIYRPSFMQSKYRGYEGEPYRSFLGSKWLNGYSDHFPVMVYMHTD